MNDQAGRAAWEAEMASILKDSELYCSLPRGQFKQTSYKARIHAITFYNQIELRHVEQILLLQQQREPRFQYDTWEVKNRLPPVLSTYFQQSTYLPYQRSLSIDWYYAASFVSRNVKRSNGNATPEVVVISSMFEIFRETNWMLWVVHFVSKYKEPPILGVDKPWFSENDPVLSRNFENIAWYYTGIILTEIAKGTNDRYGKKLKPALTTLGIEEFNLGPREANEPARAIDESSPGSEGDDEKPLADEPDHSGHREETEVCVPAERFPRQQHQLDLNSIDLQRCFDGGSFNGSLFTEFDSNSISMDQYEQKIDPSTAQQAADPLHAEATRVREAHANETAQQAADRLHAEATRATEAHENETAQQAADRRHAEATRAKEAREARKRDEDDEERGSHFGCAALSRSAQSCNNDIRFYHEHIINQASIDLNADYHSLQARSSHCDCAALSPSAQSCDNDIRFHRAHRNNQDLYASSADYHSLQARSSHCDCAALSPSAQSCDNDIRFHRAHRNNQDLYGSSADYHSLQARSSHYDFAALSPSAQSRGNEASYNSGSRARDRDFHDVQRGNPPSGVGLSYQQPITREDWEQMRFGNPMSYDESVFSQNRSATSRPPRDIYVNKTSPKRPNYLSTYKEHEKPRQPLKKRSTSFDQSGYHNDDEYRRKLSHIEQKINSAACQHPPPGLIIGAPSRRGRPRNYPNCKR